MDGQTPSDMSTEVLFQFIFIYLLGSMHGHGLYKFEYKIVRTCFETKIFWHAKLYQAISDPLKFLENSAETKQSAYSKSSF